MSNDAYLSVAIHAADDKASYDAGAKKILADKQVLAWILKYCVKEFKDCTIPVIVECIEGTPEISGYYLFPRKETADAISGMPSCDDMPNEGGVRFDIRFHAVTPKGEPMKLIIDLEAQKNFYPGYSIAARGVFYGARMISAQYGVEFSDNDYDSIKKVYSIWICMNAPRYAVNTITEYAMQPKNLYGNFQGKMKYDLLSIVIIGIGSDTESEHGSELHKVLATLLSRILKPFEKEKKLREEYGFNIGHEMKGEWHNMCNLSDLIEERGIEKGIEKGVYYTLCRLINMGKITILDAAEDAGVSMEEMERILVEYSDEKQI